MSSGASWLMPAPALGSIGIDARGTKAMTTDGKPTPEDLERRKNQPTTLLLKVVGAGLTLYCVIFMAWAGVLWTQNSELLKGQHQLLVNQATMETEIAALKAEDAEQRAAILRLSQEQQRIEVELSRSLRFAREVQ